MTDSVLIFRKRLLSYSETFVAAQATNLPTFKPIFAGVSRQKSGVALLDQQIVCLQNDCARIPALARTRLSLSGIPDKRWLRALEKHQPSLVHAHFGPGGVYGLALGKALNLPVIVTFHGYDITQHTVNRRYKKQRLELFTRANKIIAVSDFIRGRLIKAGCPEDRVLTHYMGIDVAGSSDEPVSRSVAPLVVFVGRLVKQKGCDHLIKAMQTVRLQHPDAELQIIGTGPELEALTAQAQTVGGIVFRGKLSPGEVKETLQRAWLLCNPSIVDTHGATEGLGMVFLEAQRVETPAISYATGGVVEAVVNGKTGYLVDPGNTEMLAEKVIRVIEDKALRQSMGQAGRLHIEENFNLQRQSRSLENLYREVMADHRELL